MQPTLLILILITVFCISGFAQQQQIADCFINYTKADGLKMAAPEKLPATAEKIRQVKTANGDVNITRVDGYRLLYNNKKGAAFINVKVELSDPASYGKDTANIISNLQYVSSSNISMEGTKLITLTFNGYTVYGLSRGSIESGSTLGIFAMFPGNNTTVYFHFNNLQPGVSHFTTIDEYKGLRNAFIGEYTAHLASCLR